MRIARRAALLLFSGAALSAQQPNAIYTTGAAPGMPGMPGPNTFAFVSGELVGGSPVKGAPYSGSAVTETTQALADGNRITTRTTAVVYRDGEGRERREQSLPNIGPFTPQGAPLTAIFLLDPVAGVHYFLNPNDKTALKVALPQAGSLPPMPPPGGHGEFNVMVQHGPIGAMAGGAPRVMIINKAGAASNPNPPTIEQLGTKVVEGLQAEGTRMTVRIPAGEIGNDNAIQIVDEVWRSPELQVVVHSEHSDPRMGKTVYALQNVSRSDPSPTLFQVPADYTVKDAPALPKIVPPAQ